MLKSIFCENDIGIKIIVKLVIVVFLIGVGFPLNSVYSQPPLIAQNFYGNVVLDGSPAPDGTSITAIMNNRTAGSASSSGGSYSLVINTISGDQAGDAIEFFVDGYIGGNSTLNPGAQTQLHLAATSPPPQYTLTMATNGQGTTTPSVGNHAYNQGQAVNISANPSSGWAFVNWTGDVANPNSPNTSVTMNSDKTVTANFTQLPAYTLTIGFTGEGSTSPDAGEHTYYEGDNVSISANPASGWMFSYWEGDVANPNSPNTSITMNEDNTIIAVFTQLPVLTMAISGEGTITPPPGTYIHQPGDVINITATPADNWRFVNWTGEGIADPSSAETTVTVNAAVTVTAVFAPRDSFALTILITGQGSTTPAVGTHNYPLNSTVEITAIPAAGYKFEGWTGDVADPNSATTTVTINDDKQVTANFIAVDYYQLTIEVEGSGIAEPASGTHNYPEGQTVSISAIPADGWHFSGWTGDVANPASATTTVSMNADKTVKVSFEEVPLPPVFTSINVLMSTAEQAAVIWETDKPASGYMSYWPDGGQSKSTPVSAGFYKRHAVLIEELEPGKTYHFQINAADEHGNEVTSPENTFVTIFQDADFIITGWEAFIEQQGTGKDVAINVTVENTGGVTGGYELVLSVNGAVSDSKTLSIEPGITGNTRFSITLIQAGVHTIDVNGFKFTVEVPQPDKDPIPVQPTFGQWLKGNLGLILGLLAGFVLLVVLAIIILRRYYYIVTFIRR